MSRNEPPAVEVFTLEPGAIFSEPAGDLSPADLPPDWGELHRRLTSISATFEAMLEHRDRCERDSQLAIARGWAASHQELAVYMRDHGTTREHVRLNAHARLLADLRTEIAAAAHQTGMSDCEFSSWLEQNAFDDIAGMPYVGRLREVIFHRLRNAQDCWEPNDLVDMQYLSCAAGYADVVVGEKKATHYLQRAEKEFPERSHAFASLSKAVEYLVDV